MGSHGRRTRHRRATRRLTFAAVLLGVGLSVTLVAMAGLGGHGDGGSRTSAGGGGLVSAHRFGGEAGPPAPSVDGSVERVGRWQAVLDTISARRARAWRLGDADLLSGVYLAGTPELATDRQMLQTYLHRGLRVSGVVMQFLSVEVLHERPGFVALLVVDRLGAAVAHDQAGDGLPLPRDRPTRHRIELREVDKTWRIARITIAGTTS